MSIATIVLAAGESTRMGRLKQLLPFRGQSLVRIAAQSAIDASLGPVAVVVGAHAAQVEESIKGLAASVLHNRDWAAGMGSSIRVGIGHAAKDPGVTAAIIMLADQPLVDSALLVRLAREHLRSVSGAVACRYGGSVGVPAMFPRSLFARLESLPAAGGAKLVLAELGMSLTVIECPRASTDIDTPEDYRRLTGTE